MEAGGGDLAAFSAKKKGSAFANPLNLVRPKRFELLTPWFVAKYSIQLSYGRFEGCALYAVFAFMTQTCIDLAETEGFEPSMQV
jgi:hypothetical protein